MPPGETQFDLIPFSAHRVEVHFVNPTIPHFEAAYPGNVLNSSSSYKLWSGATTEYMLAILIKDPNFCSLKIFEHSLAIKKQPLKYN